MKIILTNPRGFCEGVVRAIKTVEKALELWGAPVYVKHEIVHNRHVCDRLRGLGAIFIEDLRDVPSGQRVIYSAHGISPEVRAEAKRLKLIDIDATCPLVTKVHSAVSRHAQKGFHVVLIGHRNHVEVIGTQGEAPDSTTVVENIAEVEALTFAPDTPLFMATQTTLSLDDVSAISAALFAKYPQTQTLPSSSICYATTNRQNALKHILPRVDLVLVIGDPKSSNSRRLVEIATNRDTPAYLVNSPADINPTWLTNVSNIGLTAGASTPESIVQDCMDRLAELGVTETEEVTFTSEDDMVFQLPKGLTREPVGL